jgi:bifunctional non-homologous end joining protein LigD
MPIRGTKVPLHSDWIYEVRHELSADPPAQWGSCRLFTRNRHDWTTSYPLIVEAARRIRTKQFVLMHNMAVLEQAHPTMMR